jgi:putative oxidoreductase
MASAIFGDLTPLLSLGALALRLAAGALMMVHGAPKLLGAQRAAMKEGMKGVGVPGALFDLVALNEFLGGLALVLGLLTRLAALLIAIEMVGTIVLYNTRLWKAPIPRGYIEQAFKQSHGYLGGWELDSLLLAMGIALFIIGPGWLSADFLVGLEGA